MARRNLNETPISGYLEDSRREDGRRWINLTRAERQGLQRQQQAQAAAALFLDLKEARTWASIAEELGISIEQLKTLTKSAEFDEAYNALRADLGNDPRYKAAQSRIGDMLPLAVERLYSILTSPRTPSGILIKAVERVMELNGIDKPHQDTTNRQEIITFLQQNNINVEQVGIVLPEEYSQAMERFQVVEGEVVEEAHLASDD